jgi:hypothetical protein
MKTAAATSARDAPAKQDAAHSASRAPAPKQPVFAPVMVLPARGVGAVIQRKSACACGGGCPHCRAMAGQHAASGAQEERRSNSIPSGTDDLDETDTTMPHATGDGGVPADAGTPVASCCDQAFTAGLARTDYGGVICCSNVKHTCVWPSNFSAALTNASARTIATTCARVHEDTHHDDIDCTGAALERPNFKAGKNARAEECTAYRAEAACLTSHLGDCAADAACTSQTTSRRDTKNSQATSNCT